MLEISAFSLRIAFWGNCACFLPTAVCCSIWVLSAISPNLQAKIPDQQANIPDQQANIPDRGANKYDRRRFFALKAFFHTKGKKHVFFGQRLKFWTSGRSRNDLAQHCIRSWQAAQLRENTKFRFPASFKKSVMPWRNECQVQNDNTVVGDLRHPEYVFWQATCVSPGRNRVLMFLRPG